MSQSNLYYPISSRELEILYLIAHERTSSQIAAELQISHHAAIKHRKSLITKLGAQNTAGLVRRGFELGLLQTPKQKNTI
ncbi:MAG: helix-turn-helix transcriptional regulator [Bacteroidota bacterium]